MKKIFASYSLLLLISMAQTVMAHEFKVGSITVDHPYAAVSMAGSKNGAVYFKGFKNAGKEVDQLISVKSKIADKTEIHEMKMEGDRMMMRELNGLEIPAKGSAQLKPGGNHLMFMQLKEPFKEGEVSPVQLQFEKAGKVDIKLPVKAMGHSGMGHSKNH